MISFVVLFKVPLQQTPFSLSSHSSLKFLNYHFFVCVFVCCLNLFSAWGEGVFVVIQTAIVAALVLLYGTKPGKGKWT